MTSTALEDRGRRAIMDVCLFDAQRVTRADDFGDSERSHSRKIGLALRELKADVVTGCRVSTSGEIARKFHARKKDLGARGQLIKRDRTKYRLSCASLFLLHQMESIDIKTPDVAGMIPGSNCAPVSSNFASASTDCRVFIFGTLRTAAYNEYAFLADPRGE